MKKLFGGALLSSALILGACGGEEQEDVTVGITSNDSVAWERVVELAAEEDINLNLQTFSDYNVPNIALNDGDIDLNAFQHFAFLNEFEAANEDVDIKPIRTTVLAPLGAYSNDLEDIDDIEEGAQVVIPNDVSNQARALRLLESANLIELSDDFGLTGTPEDVTENPRNLRITPVDAQQTAHSLEDNDVALAVINNGVATRAGLNALEDPILLEPSEGEGTRPYINFIAVKEGNQDNETYQRIAELYHSEEAREALLEDTADGQVIIDLSEEEIQEIEDELANQE